LFLTFYVFGAFQFLNPTADDEWKQSPKRTLLGGSRVFEGDYGPPASKAYIRYPCLLGAEKILENEVEERNEDSFTFAVEMVSLNFL
jgi:hypothetical protein